LVLRNTLHSPHARKQARVSDRWIDVKVRRGIRPLPAAGWFMGNCCATAQLGEATCKLVRFCSRPLAFA
jgi:hypothetical protein